MTSMIRTRNSSHDFDAQFPRSEVVAQAAANRQFAVRSVEHPDELLIGSSVVDAFV